ncbi:hypothetical protein FORMA_12650 [Formosa sp. Hel3_A1_48]|nr:hypothetical protein FORMA_12650 [Formosa sp. Hel3_A1_48]
MQVAQQVKMASQKDAKTTGLAAQIPATNSPYLIGFQT